MESCKGALPDKKPVSNGSAFSKWMDAIGLIVTQGGPGLCHFVITNLCDAHCKFCNFAVGKVGARDIRFVSREDGRRAIDILYNNGIRYIEFVGGEPLLHKDLPVFISHAHRKGMTTMICTNGGRLDADSINKLKEAGLDSLVISIDAPSVAAHEQNRGIQNLCNTVMRANRELRSAGINSTASVTISKLIQNYEALPGFLKSLGFHYMTFSYPLQTLGSSYLGYSDSQLVHFGREELIDIFETIKRMKKDFHIVNNTVSLTEMQRFLSDKKQDFTCLGGYRYFLLDWNLDVYRCHFWETPMCTIDDFGPDKLIRDNCQRCMIDCYRDASVLQHAAVSISDAVKALQKRKIGEAIKKIAQKQNFWSVKANLEQLRWTVKL